MYNSNAFAGWGGNHGGGYAEGKENNLRIKSIEEEIAIAKQSKRQQVFFRFIVLYFGDCPIFADIFEG